MEEGRRSKVKVKLKVYEANGDCSIIQGDQKTRPILVKSHLQHKMRLATKDKDNEGDANETAKYESAPHVLIRNHGMYFPPKVTESEEYIKRNESLKLKVTENFESNGKTTKCLSKSHGGGIQIRPKQKTVENYTGTGALDEPRLGSTTRLSSRQAKAFVEAEQEFTSVSRRPDYVELGLTTTRLSPRQVSASAVRKNDAPLYPSI